MGIYFLVVPRPPSMQAFTTVVKAAWLMVVVVVGGVAGNRACGGTGDGVSMRVECL